MKEYRIGREAIYLRTGAAEFLHTNKTTGAQEHFFGIVTSIEDRGDYLYIGFTPNDASHNCRFGYFKLFKDGKDRAVNWRVTMA